MHRASQDTTGHTRTTTIEESGGLMRLSLTSSVLFAVALGSAACSSTPAVNKDPGRSASAAAPATREEAQSVTGNVQQWLSKICLHSYYETADLRYRLPNVSDGLVCSARRDLSGSGETGVFVGYYPTMENLDQDVRVAYPPVWRIGPNARGFDPTSGQFVLFAMGSRASERVLSPLKQFGFSVSTWMSPSAPAQIAPPAAVPSRTAAPSSGDVPSAGPIGKFKNVFGYV